MKKFTAALLAAILALSLCACSFNVTETTTESHTYADGSTVTTTTSIVNGEESTVNTVTPAEDTDPVTMGDLAADGESHDVVIKILNSTDKNMTGFYMTEVGAESAGDNMFPEDLVLAPGESSDVLTLTYSTDSLLQADIGAAFEGEEGVVWYCECDFSGCYPDDFSLEFTIDEEGGYHLFF